MTEDSLSTVMLNALVITLLCYWMRWIQGSRTSYHTRSQLPSSNISKGHKCYPCSSFRWGDRITHHVSFVRGQECNDIITTTIVVSIPDATSEISVPKDVRCMPMMSSRIESHRHLTRISIV
ncbi:hypothetical protein NPIL_425931 [Nephila pilipes]|uniref:Uncharacterized protein n=1 Tax=Nephila pilipes TaxID=299642 RepID=A0A8X6NXP2_NEPPI|nr:hypothetical protein NPIL_425931 [Nephila pilipes]